MFKKEIDALKLKIMRAHSLVDNANELEMQNIQMYKLNVNRCSFEDEKENFELVFNKKMSKLNKYKDALNQKIKCYEDRLKNLLERDCFTSNDDFEMTERSYESFNYEKFKGELIEAIKMENICQINEIKAILNENLIKKEKPSEIDLNALKNTILVYYKKFSFKNDVYNRLNEVLTRTNNHLMYGLIIFFLLILCIYRLSVGTSSTIRDEIDDEKIQRSGYYINTNNDADTFQHLMNIKAKIYGCFLSIYHFIFYGDFQ